LYKIET